MKKDKAQAPFLEQLKRIPIVQVACEKVGVSRNSVYRWRSEDPDFAKLMDEAIEIGDAIINDLGESQLLTLMKEKNWHAISFWLRKRNPRFKDRIEVAVSEKQDELTPEQEATVREALRLASVGRAESIETTEQAHEREHHTAGNSGEDDQGSESTNGDH